MQIADSFNRGDTPNYVFPRIARAADGELSGYSESHEARAIRGVLGDVDATRPVPLAPGDVPRAAEMACEGADFGVNGNEWDWHQGGPRRA